MISAQFKQLKHTASSVKGMQVVPAGMSKAILQIFCLLRAFLESFEWLSQVGSKPISLKRATCLMAGLMSKKDHWQEWQQA